VLGIGVEFSCIPEKIMGWIFQITKINLKCFINESEHTPPHHPPKKKKNTNEM
jgi:hypothetical protein